MRPYEEEEIALLEGSSSPDGEKEPFPAKVHAPRGRSHRQVSWVTIVLSVVILVDSVVYAYIAHVLLAPASKPRELELRNPYIGLEELYSYDIVNSSHHDPIINKPRLVGQVDKLNPNMHSPIDEHLMLTPYGRMASPDFHMQVSSTVRTIYQFRVLDFGMERCQLALRLPRLDDKLPDRFSFEGNAENGEVAQLDLCELDTPQILELRDLTWKSRPRCKAHAGTFSAKPGEEVLLPEFPCKWGNVLSYELSCASNSPDCLVNVWASQNSTWGIYMYQHQTV